MYPCEYSCKLFQPVLNQSDGSWLLSGNLCSCNNAVPCLNLHAPAGPTWDLGGIVRNLYETTIHDLHCRFKRDVCFHPLFLCTVCRCRSAEVLPYSLPFFSSRAEPACREKSSKKSYSNQGNSDLFPSLSTHAEGSRSV